MITCRKLGRSTRTFLPWLNWHLKFTLVPTLGGESRKINAYLCQWPVAGPLEEALNLTPVSERVLWERCYVAARTVQRGPWWRGSITRTDQYITLFMMCDPVLWFVMVLFSLLIYRWLVNKILIRLRSSGFIVGLSCYGICLHTVNCKKIYARFSCIMYICRVCRVSWP